MDYSLNEGFLEAIWNKIKSLILPSEETNFRSKILQSNVLLCFVVLILALKIGSVAMMINFPQNVFFADITRISLQNFANQARQSIGLKPLTESSKLDIAAQMKAQNMIQDNYFNHISPSGIAPWYWFSEAGYNYKYAGENLAIGFFESEEVFNAWLNSPSHKANILNPNYTEIGTAVMGGFGNSNTIIVVQVFGTPMPVRTVTKTVENTQVKPAQLPVEVTKTPEPIAKVVNTPEPIVEEKVLSKTTQITLESQKYSNANTFFYKVANSITYNYEDILQNLTYGLSLIVIGILMTVIFFYPDIKFTKAFIFRSCLLIALLSLATFINKEAVINLIPHQIFI